MFPAVQAEGCKPVQSDKELRSLADPAADIDDSTQGGFYIRRAITPGADQYRAERGLVASS